MDILQDQNQKFDQGLKGVIYIDTGISEHEIFKNLKGGSISGVKRLKTRMEGEERNSTTVLVSFRDEVLQQRVTLGFKAYQVNAYVCPPL